MIMHWLAIMGATKTLSIRLYWQHADREGQDYIRYCLCWQGSDLQTVLPSDLLTQSSNSYITMSFCLLMCIASCSHMLSYRSGYRADLYNISLEPKSANSHLMVRQHVCHMHAVQYNTGALHVLLLYCPRACTY